MRDHIKLFPMRFGEILLLAVAEAMDAAAVGAARGCVAKDLRLRQVFIVAFVFGGFQTVMPLVGWWLGSEAAGFVSEIDHWIAFALLFGLGAKMIYEARKPDELEQAQRADWFSPSVLLVLGLMTSIDAFAIGVTLPMLGAPLVTTVVTIGVVTFVLTAAAMLVGRRLGAMLGPRLELVGGVVLIGLGIKILFDHL